MFPALLDAYGRATKRATIGDWSKKGLFDDASEVDGGANESERYFVSLLDWNWWRPNTVRVTARLNFSLTSIQALDGEVCDFTLTTESMTVRFGRKAVQVSVR